MKYNKNFKPFYTLSFLVTVGISISSTQMSIAKSNINLEHHLSIDSIRSEIVNGHRFVIHKLKAKENYYQLSRMYSVPVQAIKDANNNKKLMLGDSIRIPRGKYNATIEPIKTPQSKDKVLNNTESLTEYKVGKSETLFAISKRFNITVEELKKANQLTSNSIREGLILLIPKKGLPIVEEPEVEPESVSLSELIEDNQPIEDSVFRPNRYGIHEQKERGIGVWLDSLSGDAQASLALHKSAPIGTILKITNPMNQSVTFAKVVGKFNDNEETQGAIVVLSKSVASSIGLLDKKFQVDITYGIPLE